MTDIINPALEQPTAEQIAKHYSAALDSVALINSTKPERTSDEDWADTIARNKEHLNIMLAKDFWTTEDLAPLQAAAA
jgi:dihydrodipicolinate synthase/N-acetylneuraminate lyase